jgi:RHS repeat-associated protein
VFDFDVRGVSDGVVNRADLAGFELRMRGPNQAAGGGCPRRSGGKDGDGLRDGPPPSGTFALHGRPIDVLPDGKVLLYVRARHYDPANGRWLQRDPIGYADGGNLYEGFGGNPVRWTDSLGTQFYEPSDAEMLRMAGVSEDDVQEMLLGQRQATAYAAKRYGKSAGVAALNIVPYAFGLLPGLAANALTLGLSVPTVYYEREAQFVEATGSSLTWDQAVAIVVYDMTGASTIYLIGAGEDVLTTAKVSPEEQFAAVGDVVFVVVTATVTASHLPAIRSGLGLPPQPPLAFRGLGVLPAMERGFQRVTAAAFNAQPGDYVLGSGFSIGEVPRGAAGRQLVFPFGQPRPPQIVFRVLRPDEAASVFETGLRARNPAATVTPSVAVARGSSLATQFIPTTADLNVALQFARKSGNPVVAIDLAGLPAGTRVVDLSSEAARAAAGVTHPIPANFARRSAEVLIEIEVPRSAVLDAVPIGVPRR